MTQLRKQGVGDPTVLKTLTVFRSILKRAERDGEIERNPIPLVAKPKQQVKRAPRPIAPYLVERIRTLLLDPPERRDRRGHRLPTRPESLRLRDATLVSLLAYASPRPESEALPMTFGQIGRRTLTFRATKGGTVVERETRLLEPLAYDLRHWRRHCPRAGDDALVFPGADGARWSGDDWDNWRERVFTPAARTVGLPADTRPRDLRGSFASLLSPRGATCSRSLPSSATRRRPACATTRAYSGSSTPPAGARRRTSSARPASRSRRVSHPLSTRTRPTLPPERQPAEVKSALCRPFKPSPLPELEPATPFRTSRDSRGGQLPARQRRPRRRPRRPVRLHHADW